MKILNACCVNGGTIRLREHFERKPSNYAIEWVLRGQTIHTSNFDTLEKAIDAYGAAIIEELKDEYMFGRSFY